MGSCVWLNKDGSCSLDYDGPEFKHRPSGCGTNGSCVSITCDHFTDKEEHEEEEEEEDQCPD